VTTTTSKCCYYSWNGNGWGLVGRPFFLFPGELDCVMIISDLKSQRSESELINNGLIRCILLPSTQDSICSSKLPPRGWWVLFLAMGGGDMRAGCGNFSRFWRENGRDPRPPLINSVAALSSSRATEDNLAFQCALVTNNVVSCMWTGNTGAERATKTERASPACMRIAPAS